jgi:hypothetical protein
MIKILKENGQLLLRYQSEWDTDPEWINRKLHEEGRVTICNTFTFKPNRLVDYGNQENLAFEPKNVRTFVLGVAGDNFYKIDRDILGLKHDLLISNDLKINKKTFVANRDISIFRKIDDLVNEPIIVGGDFDGSIPVSDFEELLRNFPTTAELTHYSHSRISRALKDYFETMTDAQSKLDNYLKKKRTIKPSSRVEFLLEYEPRKFEYIRDELKEMLEDAETYPEKDWQKLIVGFLLLIFPKYIAVLENLHIRDFYSNPAKSKDRYIDLTLVDANGTIDIIEIKKPFTNCLLSTCKYRDNYTPRKELAGAVMQAEKYMFHLSKWGRSGEIEILEKWKHELPRNFEIKITNPKAMIILGRDNAFADDHKFDFEIIRRKYANVIDIMTYDDLLRRLDNIISMLTHNYAGFSEKSKKTHTLYAKKEERD